MARVTKSVTAKAKHKKVLSSTKGHYGARADCIKLLNNLTSNLYNMLSETERTERGKLGLYGYPE